MSEERLRQIVMEALTGVAPEIDPDALDPDVNFRDQLELDSVNYLDFVLSVERALGVRIPEQDYPRLSCLSGCLSYLASLTDAAKR